MTRSVTCKIGGEAGFGIISSGIMLSRTFARHGYHTIATNEYPSLIRGGHNVITVRVSNDTIYALNKDVHILAALHKQAVDIHQEELIDGAVVLFDPKDFEWKQEHFKVSVTLIPIELKEMVRQKNADPVMRNTILLGAVIALMGGEFEWLKQVITDQFSKKGEQVVSYNVELAQLGYEHIKNLGQDYSSCSLEKRDKDQDQLVMNASEALALGSVKGGVKFAAIYPMTPINAVISFFADHAKQLGVVYKQPEDEIAGMNMAVGASYAGVRSMVATSGGGFALMVEALSLAGIMELPVVIDMGMRVGPATGMPTWTEAGELQFVIHAGHGEFARIVLAPGTCEECFSTTRDAFNLADQFQIPVFVLTDKYLNESQWSVRKSVFDEPYEIKRGKILKQDQLPEGNMFKRYALDTDDGVSPRSLPGMKNGQYFCNGYEHDERGLVTEDPHMRQLMADKRLKKLTAIDPHIWDPKVFGDESAQITFVTWGSMVGPVLEAMNILKAKGTSVRVIQYVWMYPFPTKKTQELFSKESRYIDVEQNSTGQLASLIREHTGIELKEKILKYDGRPIFPEDIVVRVS